MAYLKRILLGLIIGIAFITPGVSGGVLAAAIGVYGQPFLPCTTCEKF